MTCTVCVNVSMTNGNGNGNGNGTERGLVPFALCPGKSLKCRARKQAAASVTFVECLIQACKCGVNVYDARRQEGVVSGKRGESREWICGYALYHHGCHCCAPLVVPAVGFGLALFAPPLHGVCVMSFSAVTHEFSGLPLPQLGIPSMKFILIDESSPAHTLN